MENIQLLESLVIMAGADGAVTREEIELLAQRCASWGISEIEFGATLQKCLEPAAELSIPEDKESRQEMLAEMIQMMGADGHLAESEKKLFAAAATAMEITNDELNTLIDAVVDEHEE